MYIAQFFVLAVFAFELWTSVFLPISTRHLQYATVFLWHPKSTRSYRGSANSGPPLRGRVGSAVLNGLLFCGFWMNYELEFSHSPLYFFGQQNDYWKNGSWSQLLRALFHLWENHEAVEAAEFLRLIHSLYWSLENSIILKREGFIFFFFLSERSKRKWGTKDCQSRPFVIQIPGKGPAGGPWPLP